MPEYMNAKYIEFPGVPSPAGIMVDILRATWTEPQRCSVPIDQGNTDYQNIMALVDEGKLVIQPAD